MDSTGSVSPALLWFIPIVALATALFFGIRALDAARKRNRRQEECFDAELLGLCCYGKGEWGRALDYFERSRDLAIQITDRMALARALHCIGLVQQAQSNHEAARKLYEQSLAIAQELGDKAGKAKTLHSLGTLEHAQGNNAAARKLYEQSLAINQELSDQARKAATLAQMDIAAKQQRVTAGPDAGKAAALAQLGIAIRRREDTAGPDAGKAATLEQLGTLEQAEGNYDAARRLYEQCLAVKQSLGNREGVAATQGQLAWLAMQVGDDRAALRNFVIALSTFEVLRSPFRDLTRKAIAQIQARLGKEKFSALYDEVTKEVRADARK